MKNNIKYLFLGLFLMTGLVSCKKEPKEDPTPEHVCQHVCPVCQGCLDANCTDPVCATKCPGHPLECNIATAIQQEKDTNVKVEGVVYYATTDGYYIEDSSAHIFVRSTVAANIGDKVTVVGGTKLSNSKPFIQAKELTANGTGTASTAVVKTLEEVCGLAKSANQTYGTYVKVTGNIISDVIGNYYIVDDFVNVNGYKLRFSDNSNRSELAKLKGTRPEIAVVIDGADVDNMMVCFNGKAEDCVDHSHTFEEKVAMYAEADLKALFGYDEEKQEYANVYGQMNMLPAGFEGVISLTYEFSTKTVLTVDEHGNALTYNEEAEHIPGIVFTPVKDVEELVTNYIPVVTMPTTEDELVEVTCKVTCGEESKDVKFIIKNCVPTEITVKQLLEETPFYNYSRIITRGVVIAKSSNQSGSLFGLTIQDLEDPKYTTLVEIAVADASKYEIGKKIIVHGCYRNLASGDRPTIQNKDSEYPGVAEWFNIEVVDEAAVDVDYEAATLATITNGEEMQAFFANYSHNVNRVIKFVNPTLVYTSRSGGDTIDISYGEVKGVTTDRYGELIPVFVVSRVDSILGTKGWRYGIDSTEVTIDGYIYAIPGYFGSIAIHTIPTLDCIHFNNVADQAKYLVATGVDTEVFDVDVALPATVAVGETTLDLTWTSSNPDIIANDGTLTKQTAPVDVTLTAHFLEGVEERSFDIVFHVYDYRAATISSLTAEDDGKVVRVEGIVVGYTGTTSYSSAGAGRGGLVLMDEETGELLYTIHQNAVGGALRTGYVSSRNEALQVGDKVIIKGKYALDSERPGAGPSDYMANAGRHVVDMNGGSLTISSHVDTLDLSKAEYANNVLVIDSQEDLDAAFYNEFQFGKIIKLVGTEETPLYVQGNGSSWLNVADTQHGMRFSYGSNITSANAALTHKDEVSGSEGTFVPLFTAAYNELVYHLNDGEVANPAHWFDQLGFVAAADGTVKYQGTQTASSAKVKVVGECYACVSYVSTLICMSFIDPANTMKLHNCDALSDAIASIPATVNCKENITLPTEALGCAITWTSDKPEVIANDGTNLLQTSAEDVVVTLTAEITIDGYKMKATKSITVLKPKPAGYYMATSMDNLEAGQKVIFVTKIDDKYYTMKEIDDISQNISSRELVEVTFNADGGIEDLPASAAYFTVFNYVKSATGVSGKFALQSAINSDYYLSSNTGTAINLKVTNSVGNLPTSGNGYSWSGTFEQDGSVRWNAAGTNKYNVIGTKLDGDKVLWGTLKGNDGSAQIVVESQSPVFIYRYLG